MRHITIGLMLISVILVVAAYLPGHIKTWAKQPMLTAIKIWAFAHLLSNGDLGSIVLFGSFLAWAVYARIAVKRRKELDGCGGARTAAGSMMRLRWVLACSFSSRSATPSIRSSLAFLCSGVERVGTK